jgi:hypothetical protein
MEQSATLAAASSQEARFCSHKRHSVLRVNNSAARFAAVAIHA